MYGGNLRYDETIIYAIGNFSIVFFNVGFVSDFY